MPASSVLGCDRFRRGSGPISMRSGTDLEPEADRSRRGDGPISRRKWTDLGECDRHESPEGEMFRLSFRCGARVVSWRGRRAACECGRAPRTVLAQYGM